MVGTPLWWGGQFALNFLDFLMLYIVTHKMVKRYIKITPVHVLFCVAYTISLAYVFYFAGGHVFRFVIFICMLLLIKLIDKNQSLGSSFIILILYTVILSMAQFPAFAFIVSINTQLMLESPIEFLIGQLISAVLIFLICWKFRLNRWFNAVQKNPVLKLILLIAFLVFTTLQSFMNYEYDPFSLLFYTITSIIIALTLYPVIVKLYHNSIALHLIHDLDNHLNGLLATLEETEDSNTIKNQIKYMAKELGTNPDYFSKVKLDERMELREKRTIRVEQFIQNKIDRSKKNIKIIKDITYKKDYETVDFALMLKWLGTLLDNAIEVTNNNPIYISVLVSRTYLSIHVANEYAGDQGKDVRVILDKGYSTKKEGRGIGLHNLNQQVTENGGVVELEEYYDEAHDCHYLRVSIIFDKS